jgi:hypothetical protein
VRVLQTSGVSVQVDDEALRITFPES